MGVRETTWSSEGPDSRIQSLVVLLARVAAQSVATLARLEALEQQLALHAGPSDTVALLREVIAQQRDTSAAIIKGLQEHTPDTPDNALPALARPTLEPAGTDEPSSLYVAAFRLRRAEQIASRFGDDALRRMLRLLGEHLQFILGPHDRLVRWQGASFILFLNTPSAIDDVRILLAEAVASTSRSYVDLGRRVLLSIAVDWTLLAPAECPTIDAVFREVDAFLARENAADQQQEVFR